MRHSIKVQLRFNDIDILGHLNNTVYLSLYDLGKARYMEDVGLRPAGPLPPSTVIVDVHCAYIKPVHYGDDIYIHTRCSEIGDKSFVLEQEMVDGEGELRSRCRTVMVYIDHATGTSATVPQAYRDKIEKYEHGEST